MARVIVQKDPNAMLGREIYDYNGCPTFAIRDLEPHFDIDCYDVYLNDQKLELPVIEDEVMVSTGSGELYIPMLDDDVLVVINRPQGFDPVTAAIIVAVSVTASVALTFLLTPKVPGDQGQVKESSNNKLEGQTNIARTYQALPNIYGEPIPYPDLTGEAEQEYVQRTSDLELSALKVVKQLMCITVGTYFETDVFSGNTLLSQFDGTYTMYRPVGGQTIVPEVTETFRVSEVNQQELFGINQMPEEYSFSETAASPNSTTLFATGPSWILSINLSDYPTFNAPQTEYPRAGTLAIVGEEQISGDPVSFSIDVTWNGNNFGPGPSREMLISASSNVPISDTVINITDIDLTVNETVNVGPFKLPVASDEVWVDIIFDRGLKGEASFALEYSVSGTGGWVNISNFSYSKDSFDQQFFTHKYVFGAPADGFVRIRRTNVASEDANTPDLAKLERIAGIVKTQNKNYGNVTLIEVEVPASRDVSNLRENEINLRGNRYVISYDRVTKQVDYTLRASRLGADHILHEWVEVFNKDPDLLDLEEMYLIWDNLPDPRLGYFDYTFDDLDVPLGERIQTIANAARVYAFQDAGIWRFKRDELQTIPKTIMTRRDIKGSNRKFSYKYSPNLNASKDSIRLEYVDPAINKLAYIRRKLDGGVIVDGEGANPLIVEMPYIKEEYNAINRAELEMRKLIYLRESFSDTLTQQGMLLEKGDKFIYEEVYNKTLIGGDIRRIDGNTAYTSEKIDFSLGTLFVEYNDINGSVIGPFEIAPGPNEKSFTMVTGDLSAAYVTDNVIQRPSQFRVSTLATLEGLQYIVQDKVPSEDGLNVQLNFVRADNRVYAYDSV